MKAIVYLTDAAQIPAWSEARVTEVILAPKELSRRGTGSLASMIELANQANAVGLTPVLEWDALMEGPRFRECSASVLRLPKVFRAVRARDAGAALWLRDHTDYPIQLLLEAGHHNLPALQTWQSRLGLRLQRLCLSPELTLKTLQDWRTQLDVPFEVLGLGPLLLFHSPRALLTSLATAPASEEVWAEGASEESPHKGFLLSENSHGTLMFHPKDLGLLERWSDLEAAGVDVVRIDHRREKSELVQGIVAFLKAPQDAGALKSAWSQEWMRGYLDVNKSDVLFDRLKNDHLKRDERSCGEVLEGKREAWLAVRVSGHITAGETIQIINPKGESTSLELAWIKDDAFQPVTTLTDGQVGFLPWTRGVPSKSKLQR
jgi:putative protease